MTEEKRIYVVVAATIQTTRNVVQPSGRQFAQGCHVTSKLRFQMTQVMTLKEAFAPITTIILQARDSAELDHVYDLLARKKLQPVEFLDNNPEYDFGNWPTAVAVFATPKQVKYILDYLPLWGAK